MDSDEYRVWMMNNMLAGEARVLTMNRFHVDDNDFHLDHDTQLMWAEHVNREVTALGGVITDVWLDYFFFVPSWYRRSYGVKWLENLGKDSFNLTLNQIIWTEFSRGSFCSSIR